MNNTSSQAEIKDSYLNLVKKFHPDAVALRSQAEKIEITKQFQVIQEAYDVLSNESSKKEYDDVNYRNVSVVKRQNDMYSSEDYVFGKHFQRGQKPRY